MLFLIRPILSNVIAQCESGTRCDISKQQSEHGAPLPTSFLHPSILPSSFLSPPSFFFRFNLIVPKAGSSVTQDNLIKASGLGYSLLSTLLSLSWASFTSFSFHIHLSLLCFFLVAGQDSFVFIFRYFFLFIWFLFASLSSLDLVHVFPFFAFLIHLSPLIHSWFDHHFLFFNHYFLNLLHLFIFCFSSHCAQTERFFQNQALSSSLMASDFFSFLILPPFFPFPTPTMFF